jgi:hypothetical protein
VVAMEAATVVAMKAATAVAMEEATVVAIGGAGGGDGRWSRKSWSRASWRCGAAKAAMASGGDGGAALRAAAGQPMASDAKSLAIHLRLDGESMSRR